MSELTRQVSAVGRVPDRAASRGQLGCVAAQHRVDRLSTAACLVTNQDRFLFGTRTSLWPGLPDLICRTGRVMPAPNQAHLQFSLNHSSITVLITVPV